MGEIMRKKREYKITDSTLIFFGLSIFLGGLVGMGFHIFAFLCAFVFGFAFGWTLRSIATISSALLVAIFQQPQFVGLICVYWVLCGIFIKSFARKIFPEYRDEWFLRND